MFLSSEQSTVFQYSSIGTVVFFRSDYVPTLDNETFAIINSQPSIMQGAHWTKNANSCHNWYFPDSLGRPSFLKHQYKQMMPEPLQSHPSVCSFYVTYAIFHFLKFGPKVFTVCHIFNVFPFTSKYM